MTSPIPPHYGSFTQGTSPSIAIRQGSDSNSGAILTKDSLEVPLESQVSISSDSSAAGHPYLAPPTQVRVADESQEDDAAYHYYLDRRANSTLKLSQNETNPNLLALDDSWKFEGNIVGGLIAFAKIDPTKNEG
jgi:hypothetical protein